MHYSPASRVATLRGAAALAPVLAAAQDSALTDTVTAAVDTVAAAAATAAEVGSLEPVAGAFVSLGALAAAVLPVTGWLHTHLLKTVNPQYLSWVVSLALGAAGFALKLGIFAAATPTAAALYAVAAGLIANGVANLKVVKVALAILGARVKTVK